MAIAYISSLQTFTTSGAVSTAGANLLIAATDGTTSTAAPTDNKGNTWTALTQYATGTGLKVRLFYAVNPVVGTGHTFQNNSVGQTTLMVAWFSGANTSAGVFDPGTDSGATTASNVTTLQTGSITPTSAGELLISSIADPNAVGITYAINNSFTVIQLQSSFDANFALAYLIDAGNSAINPTWTRSSATTNMVTNIAAFTPPTGASAPPEEDFWVAPWPAPTDSIITVF